MVVELIAPKGKCAICDLISEKRVIVDTSYMSWIERELIYRTTKERFGKAERELGKIFYVCPECYTIVMEEYNQRFNGGEK